MATKWGRNESIIWPPHVPIRTYTAIAGAVLCTLLFVYQRLHFTLTPLQQSYIGEYIRSEVGATFKAHQTYRLVYLAGAHMKPRLALPVDLSKGKTTLPNGRITPVALTELPLAQGYLYPFRGPSQKLSDTVVSRWLRGAIFDNHGVMRTFLVSWIEGGALLVFLLWFSVPADLRRFKVLKYGRVLRGPLMVTPKGFNDAQAAKDKRSLSTRFARLTSRFTGDKPVLGMGFKTTELKEMMRIPPGKEAQHFQLMGDTGSGKTQLIMQLLRQIRDRGDVAIVYDPAGEFAERFLDEERGDYILNPLDARCPYWSPSSEMEVNQEATAIAASLYQPTSTSTKDEFFYRAPAKIFAHLLKEGPDPHVLADWLADEPKLQRLVAGTEYAFFINRKAGPQAAGVLSSLGMTAESLRLLPREETSTRQWSAVDWAKERKGWIFLTSRKNEREILRPLISLWIDMLVMRLMTRPEPDQKKVWFVIDELASLQKLPQLHTAMTESRKSKNPLVLGFQGRSQLQDIYGKLSEVMISQPSTKIFMRTSEPEAAKWISDAIGHVEIERIKETKFDGSRSGKNFTIDRQIEPLVIPSEITGLDDRHAYLKLGNHVARFDFDYIDLAAETTSFIPRDSPDDKLKFDRRVFLGKPSEPTTSSRTPEPEKATGSQTVVSAASAVAPITNERRLSPIPWPNQQHEEAQSNERKKADTEQEMPSEQQQLIAEVHVRTDGHEEAHEYQMDLSLDQ
jgi:hypothetical protein